MLKRTHGTFCIDQFILYIVCEHDLINRLHIHMWLLKKYAISAGMHANQVWATPFLRQGKEMHNPSQNGLLMVLKRVVMIWDTATSWCIIRECGLLDHI